MISITDSNHLLAAMSPAVRDRVLKLCERVTLAQDDILGQPGEPISHVYFPTDGFILLLTDMNQRDAMGVGLIGNEGMLGVSLAQGIRSSSLRARVQGAGSALRMKAVDFQGVLDEAPILEQQLGRYLHILFAHVAQTATCAAFHVVDLRLAYWLLMIHDRAHGDRFYLTHHQLARMLGVRRSGVSTAAGVLQSHKLISYTRGHIAILDRKGLEQAACGCYRAERQAFKQFAARDEHRHHMKDAHRGRRPPHTRKPNGRDNQLQLA